MPAAAHAAVLATEGESEDKLPTIDDELFLDDVEDAEVESLEEDNVTRD